MNVRHGNLPLFPLGCHTLCWSAIAVSPGCALSYLALQQRFIKGMFPGFMGVCTSVPIHSGSVSGVEYLPAGSCERDSLGAVRVVDSCHAGGVLPVQPAILLLALPVQVSQTWCLAAMACHTIQR